MGIIRSNESSATALGNDLREGSRAALRRRRGIFGLFLAATASMGVVALYQLGILKRLPDPPLPRFDSERVTSSGKAYSLLETPDSVLAIGSYAATMGLAAIGAPDRARTRPLLPMAMAAKVGIDAAVGLTYAYGEWSKNRRLCFWCLVASAAAVAAVPLAVPEARAALRELGYQGLKRPAEKASKARLLL